jgi:hypothetical protein
VQTLGRLLRKLLRTMLPLLLAAYLGGVLVLASFYAVWLAVNPGCHMHWYIVQTILGWPWYRAIDIIAYCF